VQNVYILKRSVVLELEDQLQIRSFELSVEEYRQQEKKDPSISLS
jgi:hypothetical protein